jgi:proteasome alpha subunit
MEPDGVGVATITADDEQYREVPADELEAILADHDLLAEPDDEDDAGDAE